MGSWYISRLIKDAIAIRSGNSSDWVFEIDFLSFGQAEAFKLHENDDDLFDSDDYNNLLVLEKKIYDLYTQGKITPFELKVIMEMSKNKSKKQLIESLGKNYETIMSIFDRLTEMLAFSLGNEFTNQGYLNYIVTKYNLNNQQIEKLNSYMNYKGIK